MMKSRLNQSQSSIKIHSTARVTTNAKKKNQSSIISYFYRNQNNNNSKMQSTNIPSSSSQVLQRNQHRYSKATHNTQK